jgi:S1-C subfamily serine protease
VAQRYRADGRAVSRFLIPALCLILIALAGGTLLERSERYGPATRLVPITARQARLTSDLIPHSMVPSADLPLVDITTEKIPEGLTERGTSFYLGHDLWISARHVVNNDCARIILIIAGKNVDAQIVYLDESADLAVLRAPTPAALPLALADPGPDPTDRAYAFGFPQGTLGATADSYLGRTRLRLGGRLVGTAPVLAWTELDREPADFDSIAGISGGPIIDANGYVIGIIVAASVRRGRNYTVAPELLLYAERRTAQNLSKSQPVPDIVTPPVSLSDSAKVLERSARIVLTYCIPG